MILAAAATAAINEFIATTHTIIGSSGSDLSGDRKIARSGRSSDGPRSIGSLNFIIASLVCCCYCRFLFSFFIYLVFWMLLPLLIPLFHYTTTEP